MSWLVSFPVKLTRAIATQKERRIDRDTSYLRYANQSESSGSNVNIL